MYLPVEALAQNLREWVRRCTRVPAGRGGPRPGAGPRAGPPGGPWGERAGAGAGVKIHPFTP